MSTQTLTEPKFNINPKPLQIVNLFVLDKSGSMQSIKQKIIEGYNEQLQDIKRLDRENGTESLFGLITFDSSVVVRYLNEPINIAEELTATSYRPEGGTAFYDAIVDAIKALETKLGSDLTEAKVLVTFLTDGDDTSSRRFYASQARDLIKQFEQDYKWTFSFIGANIDMDALATTLGVSTSNTLNFTADAVGTQAATRSLISARASYYSKSLNGEDTTQSFFAATEQK